MLKRKKPDSASFSDAAVVVENDSTPPKRKKTQAQMERHRVNCKNYRLRKKDNMVFFKKNYDNMVAEHKKMKEELERTQSELQEQYQEKISKLESDVLALGSVLQQKDEEIARLKQSPIEWPFEELRERGIQSAGEVQDFLIQESDNYKQDVQDPGNELWNWTTTGLMTDGEHDDNLCLTQSELDLIYGSTTIDNTTTSI